MGRARRSAAVNVLSAVVGGLFLLATHPWIYRGCFQDADPVQMAVGTDQALTGGLLFRDPLLYRPAAHPLYYGLLFLGASARGTGIDPLIAQMNHLSWLAMGLSMAVLYLILRRLASPGWCLLVVAAVASCPTILALGTYGHPASVGLLFFLLGTLCLLRTVSGETGSRSRFVGWWLAAVTLLAAAVAVRAHVVFLFTAPLALCLALGARPRRALATGAAALVLAGVVYAVGTRLLFGPTEASPLQQLATFVATYYRPRSIHLGLLLGGYALAPGLGLLLAGGVVALLIRRRWTPLLLGAACFLPTFLFWAGHPLPLRHFMHAIVGAAFLLALVGQRDRPLGRLAVSLGIVTVTVLNLALLPTLGALAAAAGYRHDGPVVGALTTSVFESHRMRQEYWDWERARWAERAATVPDRTLFIGRYYELMAMMLAAERMDEARGPASIRTEGSDDLWAIGMGEKEFYFLGWDGRTPESARHARDDVRRVDVSAVRIVAPYTDDQLRLMPPGLPDLPPRRLWYRAIE